ncbi:MAG: hypothetical protein AMJ45_02580 [Syntrophobacter sp. DG_60]|nr:MAG: hypothetical protein AMJ45_02580 [Syntrophobacter sp. DG_60]
MKLFLIIRISSIFGKRGLGRSPRVNSVAICIIWDGIHNILFLTIPNNAIKISDNVPDVKEVCHRRIWTK